MICVEELESVWFNTSTNMSLEVVEVLLDTCPRYGVESIFFSTPSVTECMVLTFRFPQLPFSFLLSMHPFSSTPFFF
jgi:hypothetical protein